jgi:hypothetical protein
MNCVARFIVVATLLELPTAPWSVGPEGSFEHAATNPAPAAASNNSRRVVFEFLSLFN